MSDGASNRGGDEPFAARATRAGRSQARFSHRGRDATFLDRSGEIAQSERFSLTLSGGCRIDLERKVAFA